MKRFFKQIKFWLEWSYWLRCKHCCVGCKYFDSCISEVEQLEDKLDFKSYF